MSLQRLIASCSVLALVFVGNFPSAAAAAADTPVVSMQQQGDNFVYGERQTIQSFGYQQGFFMRSVHSLWDGSKAVFVNNVNPADGQVSPNTSKDGAVVEFLMMIYRSENGGPLNVPVPAEAERSGKGLSALAQDDSGAFWTIKQGKLEEKIAAPGAGAATLYHSSQIMKFVVGGVQMTVDLAALNMPKGEHAPYAKELAYGGGVLYVIAETGGSGSPGDSIFRVAALKPEDGTLLYTLPANPNTEAVPMKDGKLGLYEGGKLTVYDSAGHEDNTIDLGKRFPFLSTNNYSRFIPEDKGERYIYQTRGEWYELNAGFDQVLGQTAYTTEPFPTQCDNCPGLNVTVPVTEELGLHIVDQVGYEKFKVKPLGINTFGVPLYTESPPYMDAAAGTVWVPLRDTAEAMNVKVSYDGNRNIVLTYLDKTITISQDHPQIEMVTLQEFGDAYVSVRQLSDLLGQDVTWDADTFTVVIGKDKPLVNPVHPDLLKDRDALLERLSHVDDFIGKSYTESELKLLFYEGSNVDYKHVLQDFMDVELHKDLANFETIADNDSSRWLAVVTKDNRVYKIGMQKHTEYGGLFWTVNSYGELVWQGV